MLSDWRSGRAELTPLGKSSGTISLEVGSTDEVALLIEVVVDRGMGGGELLQATHPPEALHCPLSSSQRLMSIFDAVVQPAAGALAALDADDFQGRAIGAKPVYHNDLGPAVPLDRFPQKFQRCPAIPPLADEGFQNLPFVIDGAPEIMRLAVYLQEHLVEVPLPMMELPHARDAASANFGREDRPEPVPPEAHAFVADLDAALVQHVLDVPQRERKPDVEHHREADDLRARLEVPERVVLLHPPKLRPGSELCNGIPLTLPVELFDGHSVSFVSVTQHFNTTSSMGRLTLNVLLSFAQFEREVSGERIRDKIAASKKKGMRMGGPVALGYIVENKKLVIDEAEAETVNLIFTRRGPGH
jgi:hypothetical protein